MLKTKKAGPKVKFALPAYEIGTVSRVGDTYGFLVTDAGARIFFHRDDCRVPVFNCMSAHISLYEVQWRTFGWDWYTGKTQSVEMPHVGAKIFFQRGMTEKGQRAVKWHVMDEGIEKALRTKGIDEYLVICAKGLSQVVQMRLIESFQVYGDPEPTVNIHWSGTDPINDAEMLNRIWHPGTHFHFTCGDFARNFSFEVQLMDESWVHIPDPRTPDVDPY